MLARKHTGAKTDGLGASLARCFAILSRYVIEAGDKLLLSPSTLSCCRLNLFSFMPTTNRPQDVMVLNFLTGLASAANLLRNQNDQLPTSLFLKIKR